MAEKVRLGISSCLLGERVRYDGGHKLDNYLVEVLGSYVEWVPVCPEVEAGLGVPREPMRLTGDAAAPRLVTRDTGDDHTGKMKRWASGRLGELKKEKLCGFVFKSGSPSSGLEGVKVFAPGGVATHRGSGIFARALMAALPLLPVADEEHLRDPEARRGFIKRVYVYHRWRELTQQRRSINRLVDFHQRHEYLIMAHSPERLRLLDELLAGQADEGAVNLYHSYGSLLMEALKFKSTVRKNNRVLQLSIRRLEPLLTSGEQKELRRTVGDYNRSVVPLVVPVTLISYFARKYDDRFLKGQLYINPGPAEMMLENHA